MKHAFILFVLIQLSSTLSAQDTWLKLFGGANADVGMCVISTADGGVIAAGVSQSKGGGLDLINKGSVDFYLARLDKNGNVEWSKCFGGSGVDTVTSIAATLDGGVILTGHTTSTDGDFPASLQSNTDIFVILLDRQGNVQWNRRYGGSGRDQSHSVITMSEGWIITGLTTSSDGDFKLSHRGWEDVVCFRLNTNGEVVWTRTLGHEIYLDGGLSSVIAAESDGVFITGYRSPLFRSGAQLRLMLFTALLDAEGKELWCTYLGGKYSSAGTAATSTTDGGVVVAGFTHSHETNDTARSRGEEDVILTKLDVNGNVVWKSVLGGTGSERPRAVSATDDGGFVVTGYTQSNDQSFDQRTRRDMDAFAARYTSDGKQVWLRCFGGRDSDDCRSVAMMADGGFVVTGVTFSNDSAFTETNMGRGDMFVGRFDRNGLLNPVSGVTDPQGGSVPLAVYPNPVLGQAAINTTLDKDMHVRLEIISVLAQTVDVLLDGYQLAGTLRIPLDTSNFPPGPYAVRLVSATHTASTMFVVSR
jgi:hypothetical protein